MEIHASAVSTSLSLCLCALRFSTDSVYLSLWPSPKVPVLSSNAGAPEALSSGLVILLYTIMPTALAWGNILSGEKEG